MKQLHSPFSLKTFDVPNERFLYNDIWYSRKWITIRTSLLESFISSWKLWTKKR